MIEGPFSSRTSRDTLHIALSVGGTKIGTGAVNAQGDVVAQLPEVPTPKEVHLKYEAIGDQVAAIVDKIGIDDVRGLGVSFPECIPPPERVVADPGKLPTEKSDVQSGIEEAVARRLGIPLPTEVLHDAAAAVLGEVSIKGTLPSCENVVFVVWGTGVASGIIRKGNLYWTDAAIGIMTGEIGLLTIRNRDGEYEYRPQPSRIRLSPGEETLDRRHRGPSILGRCIEQIGKDPRGRGFVDAVGKSIELIDLKDLNGAARAGNDFAIETIEEAGREMGMALVPFIHYWREVRRMDFVENIIIGSGVAKIGAGVEQDGKGTLVEAVRTGIREAWSELRVPDFNANNVILSKIGYEREFFAFLL